MPDEFEGDLREAVFWGADLTGATFRDVNLTGARISHAWLTDVEIDALVDRVVINGVDVTDYVNAHDRWYPLRAMLRPPDPEGMRATWDAIERQWEPTIARTRTLTDAQQRQSVRGEWSFVETLRHLLFAMDKWCTDPILGEAFHPYGVPNAGSRDFGWPGLDLDADPPLDAVLAVRRQRAGRFRDFLATVTVDDLGRRVDVLENGPHPVRECVYTVFEEEFWHYRYATRDLDLLD